VEECEVSGSPGTATESHDEKLFKGVRPTTKVTQTKSKYKPKGTKQQQQQTKQTTTKQEQQNKTNKNKM